MGRTLHSPQPALPKKSLVARGPVSCTAGLPAPACPRTRAHQIPLRTVLLASSACPLLQEATLAPPAPPVSLLASGRWPYQTRSGIQRGTAYLVCPGCPAVPGVQMASATHLALPAPPCCRWARVLVPSTAAAAALDAGLRGLTVPELGARPSLFTSAWVSSRNC